MAELPTQPTTAASAPGSINCLTIGRKIYPKVENSLVCNHFRGILKVFTYVMYPLTGLDYWIGMEHWTGLLEPPLYFFRKGFVQ